MRMRSESLWDWVLDGKLKLKRVFVTAERREEILYSLKHTVWNVFCIVISMYVTSDVCGLQECDDRCVFSQGFLATSSCCNCVSYITAGCSLCNGKCVVNNVQGAVFSLKCLLSGVCMSLMLDGVNSRLSRDDFLVQWFQIHCSKLVK